MKISMRKSKENHITFVVLVSRHFVEQDGLNILLFESDVTYMLSGPQEGFSLVSVYILDFCRAVFVILYFQHLSSNIAFAIRENSLGCCGNTAGSRPNHLLRMIVRLDCSRVGNDSR